ncbi:MAG: hypothetical protein ABUS76_00435 [Candidatus Shikimatogenerans sp. Ttur]|uniref:Uncharacterized protein n=1 Tax=Candidatus Shikimatogenerans sp. Ttur TaxID=3158569 RepID=A0AAU7ZXR7_9FLAO
MIIKNNNKKKIYNIKKLEKIYKLNIFFLFKKILKRIKIINNFYNYLYFLIKKKKIINFNIKNIIYLYYIKKKYSILDLVLKEFIKKNIIINIYKKFNIL